VISDAYREQNRLLHLTQADYGSGSGLKYEKFIREVMSKTGSVTVLDYGCGKGTLGEAFGDCVTNYDPAVEKWAGDPAPADLVVCTDVLEHVEPEYLQDVMDHLRSLARRAAFIVVSCRPARRQLPDGRNAHLTVEPPEWWEAHIRGRFRVLSKHVGPDSLMVLCR
jgi:hypothetical protein